MKISKIYNNLGLICSKSKKIAEAIDWFEKSYEIRKELESDSIEVFLQIKKYKKIIIKK